MDAAIEQKVATWLYGDYDEATKNAIKELQANNEAELADSFYRSLEFGTGGCGASWA